MIWPEVWRDVPGRIDRHMLSSTPRHLLPALLVSPLVLVGFDRSKVAEFMQQQAPSWTRGCAHSNGHKPSVIVPEYLIDRDLRRK